MEDFIKKFHATIERMTDDEEYAAELMIGKVGNPITLGPRVKDATTWVNDMVAGAKARSKNWLDNSLRPKKDPKKAALDAAGKYEDRMRTALDEKHYDAGVAAYDEAAREEVIKSVGARGFEEGVERHKPKALSKVKKLQPLVTALAATLDAMPVDTEAQREAKMIAAKRGMQDIGKQMRG